MFFRSWNSFFRDSLVEGHEHPFHPLGHGQKVNIREVSWCEDRVVVDESFVTEAYRIVPEMVVLGVRGISQASSDVSHGESSGISRLRHDADAGVLCERAGGPTLGSVS